MNWLRARLEEPIGDRRRAFAIAAVVLLIAAVALSALAAPPDRQPTTEPAVDRQPVAGRDPAAPADIAPAAVRVARRFLAGYLAHLYGDRPAREIAGAAPRLRAELARQPVRVTPAMRRHRPRVVDLDAHRLDGDWLIDAEIAAGSVSFEIALVVADGVVTRLVED
jgi:hypothetical protein